MELQRDTWGRTFSDVVPASLLQVSQRVGGIAAGAFDASGALLGFVYGITGVERGRIVHWSDMLAVRPEARDLGLGRRLKDYQRRVVRELGAEVIYWTYDPLVARNAHLNFNVLGVRAVEYVPDMYGETDSVLHRGIGTDRFIVGWPTSETECTARLAETTMARENAALRSAPIVNAHHVREPLAPRGDAARIEIPLDINALQQDDPEEALAWRRATRPAFQRTVCVDFDVAGFYVDADAKRGYYLLARTDTKPTAT